MQPAELDKRIVQTRTVLRQRQPSTIRSTRWKQGLLARSITQPLDRIRVLGDEEGYGHSGCVNAVSWAQNGELLLTGGDDTTVRMWKINPAEPIEDCPLECTSVIHTGHNANIFGIQMLPYSTKIATCALDSQVRVSDIGNGAPIGERETAYATGAANVAVFRCHSGSTKRILTEESPDHFLTVSKDGTVRQHDLRLPPHRCRRTRYGTGQGEGCRAPLARLSHDLSAIGGSPLAPHYFVVAGEGPYGYLFDRRHSGRFVEAEWGRPLDKDSITTCVRRFGRRTRGRGECAGYEHVTGARMARSNGHEVLLSYSADGVHLFSIYDEPSEKSSVKSSESGILSPNRSSTSSSTVRVDSPTSHDGLLPEQAQETLHEDEDDFPMVEDNADGEDEDNESDSSSTNEKMEDIDEEEEEDGQYESVPLIHSRGHYTGIANVETVKDVNFIGPSDEFVVSGSDDGNWFIWDKITEEIHGIYEGDGTIVNVIEPHPYLPLIATSGIDTTVKLFGLARGAGPAKFSRLDRKESVVHRNEEAAAHSAASQADLARLLLHYRVAARMGASADDEEVNCRTQ